MSEQDGQSNARKPRERRTTGFRVKAPGVEVRVERETLGELTEQLSKDAKHAEERLSEIATGISIFAAIAGVVVAISSSSIHIGTGSGSAIAAGVIATVASLLLKSVFTLVSDIQEKANPPATQAFPPRLGSLQRHLDAMRTPLLQRSRVNDSRRKP